MRRAGRKLKLKCHPDKSSGSPGANVAFQRVQEAEGVLLDDEKVSVRLVMKAASLRAH